MQQRFTSTAAPTAAESGEKQLSASRWLPLLGLGLLLATQARAQDVIIKNDKSEINAKVVEITEDFIKYRLFDFLDGPLYNIRKTDVWMIIYEKGRREKFNVPEQTAAAPVPAAPAAGATPAAAPSAAPAPASAAPAAATPTAPAPAVVPAAAVPATASAPAPEAPAVPQSGAAPAAPVTAEAASAPAPAAQLAVVQEPAASPATTAAPAATPAPAAAGSAPAAPPVAEAASPAPAAPAPVPTAEAAGSPVPATPSAAPAPTATPATPDVALAAPGPAATGAEAGSPAPMAATTAPVAAEAAPAAGGSGSPVAATPAPAPVAPHRLQREPAAEAERGQIIWAKLGNGPAPVKYINVDGNILILKANFVMSLAKNTGKQLWVTKVERTKSAHLIGNGPLIQVVAASANGEFVQSVILNSENGKALYSPPAVAQLDNRIVDAHNLLVWEATATGTRVLLLDKVSGARLHELKIAPGWAKAARVLPLPGGNVCVVSSYGVSALDPAKGQLLYNLALKRSAKVDELLAPTEPTFDVLETSTPGVVGILKDGYLSSVNIRSGQLLGEKELPGAVVSYREADQDQLVIGKSGKKDKDLLLTVLDKRTARELRAATLDISNAGAMQPFGNDLFVVGGGSAVKLVDLSTLRIKADKTFKSSGDNVQLFANERGVGLLSAACVEYFNAQNYAALGKTRYFDPAGRIKLKQGDDTYFWANGYLGRVNLHKGEEALLLKDKLPLKLLDNEAPQLELLDDGLAVVTAQSVAKVDFQGHVVYQQYFTPPVVVAGAIAAQTTAQAAEAVRARAAATKQSWFAAQRAFEQGSSEAVYSGPRTFTTVLRHHIVLTKADKDEVGRFKLLKINKATGKVEGQVEVENRTPDYIFDPVDSVVYLFDVDSVRAYKI